MTRPGSRFQSCFGGVTGLLFGLCLAAQIVRSTDVPGGGHDGPPVSAYMTGKNIVLANGIVTATIRPDTAEILSLKYKGREMVSQTGRHQRIYFFLYGDKGYDRMAGCVPSVKTRTPEMVDISCKRTYSPGNAKMHPCDEDTHFVLRRGMSGLYVYSILDHPADYPELKTGQYLMIWSMPYSDDQWLMENIYVDQARHWEIPSMADLARQEQTGIQEIVKLTTGPWKGRYDCKYMYTAPYWDLGCWGFASDRNQVGAWVVFGSHEFFNNGPSMSDLTAATGIIHVMFNMNHYGGSTPVIPRGVAWQKIYGPHLIYCNSSPVSSDACWADALHQADAEKAAWPYSWLTDEKAYPLDSGRSSITGKLVVHDRLKPGASGAGAWVGVAQLEPDESWQYESAKYQYWVHADAEGRFTIPHVRPGTYALHAFNTGMVGEYSHTNVTVQTGRTTDLGELIWNVPHPGASLAWEIGVPDRTAREFRHGDDYFQPLMWEKFSAEFANPLEYTVGSSDWSKDWNYVHCGYLVGTNWSQWKWRIHFNLTNAPAEGNATLTLAYASSYYGRTEVYVNDESQMFTLVRPAADGGNALIREGIHAKYCVEQVPIPASRLNSGTNTLTLVQGENRYDRPFFHVMYDYLNLELPAATSSVAGSGH